MYNVMGIESKSSCDSQAPKNPHPKLNFEGKMFFAQQYLGHRRPLRTDRIFHLLIVSRNMNGIFHRLFNVYELNAAHCPDVMVMARVGRRERIVRLRATTTRMLLDSVRPANKIVSIGPGDMYPGMGEELAKMSHYMTAVNIRAGCHHHTAQMGRELIERLLPQLRALRCDQWFLHPSDSQWNIDLDHLTVFSSRYDNDRWSLTPYTRHTIRRLEIGSFMAMSTMDINEQEITAAGGFPQLISFGLGLCDISPNELYGFNCGPRIEDAAQAAVCAIRLISRTAPCLREVTLRCTAELPNSEIRYMEVFATTIRRTLDLLWASWPFTRHISLKIVCVGYDSSDPEDIKEFIGDQLNDAFIPGATRDVWTEEDFMKPERQPTQKCRREVIHWTTEDEAGQMSMDLDIRVYAYTRYHSKPEWEWKPHYG